MTTVTIPGGSGDVPQNGTLIVDGPVAETDIIHFWYDHWEFEGSGTLVINDVTSFSGQIWDYFSVNIIKFGNSGISSVVVDRAPTDLPSGAGYGSARVNVFVGPEKIGSFVLVPSVGDHEFFDDSFTLGFDAGFFTLSTSHARCFAAGTRLLTPQGEVAVEALTDGDELVTALGHGPRRVRWIGRRDIDVTRHPRPWDVAPIRVRAGAFGRGRPAVDVVLSPDHAVLLDGRLFPVRYLVNGATILPDGASTVTYYHVELASDAGAAVHDIVLASGLPVESFLDTDGRAGFANGGTVTLLVPSFARKAWDSLACAELILDGPHLVAARRFLLREAARQGHRLTINPEPRLLLGTRCLVPQVRRGGYRFHLPPHDVPVRLVSHSFVPAQVHPESNDCRRLGLGVTRLLRDGRPVDLADLDAGNGWHALEQGLRWTTGETLLDCVGVRILDIEIELSACYWTGRDSAQRSAA